MKTIASCNSRNKCRIAYVPKDGESVTAKRICRDWYEIRTAGYDPNFGIVGRTHVINMSTSEEVDLDSIYMVSTNFGYVYVTQAGQDADYVIITPNDKIVKEHRRSRYNIGDGIRVGEFDIFGYAVLTHTDNFKTTIKLVDSDFNVISEGKSIRLVYSSYAGLYSSEYDCDYAVYDIDDDLIIVNKDGYNIIHVPINEEKRGFGVYNIIGDYIGIYSRNLDDDRSMIIDMRHAEVFQNRVLSFVEIDSKHSDYSIVNIEHKKYRFESHGVFTPKTHQPVPFN